MSFVDEFYVVDARYPNISGFLDPYRGERYHRNDLEVEVVQELKSSCLIKGTLRFVM